MPDVTGFSHVSLSVRDLDRSERWYVEVLGLRVLDRPDGETWREVVLGRPELGVVVCLQEHADRTGEDFDPRRTGLDHVAFAVRDRAGLEAWQARLAELGVRHSPVTSREYGDVLCLRDPDGLQLELFVLDAALAERIRQAR